VNNRPELEKAMKRCRLTGATLLVAKLDRLSRNAAFLMTLKDSGVPFVAADMPDANTLTIGVMASLAQHERETSPSAQRRRWMQPKRGARNWEVYVLARPTSRCITSPAMLPSAPKSRHGRNCFAKRSSRCSGLACLLTPSPLGSTPMAV
jgi:hypothetical protein